MPSEASPPFRLPKCEPPKSATANQPLEVMHARSAGLRYVSDTRPGIRRVRRGRSFSYSMPDGSAVKDQATLDRIRSLAIPPAYQDVWICPSPHGHIQATGRDQRGRKQYRYHPGWLAVRDSHKFDRLLSFAEALPRVRREVDAALALRKPCREKVLASVIRLLDTSLIRVGNTEYAKGNGSFGLTTLQTKHVALEGPELRFRFTGKSGKVWQVVVTDRRIARVVKAIQDLPGQDLFQYVDEEGCVRDVDSLAVNAYLREIAGIEVSAKDFRTWAGTVLMAHRLTEEGGFSSAAEAKRKLRRALNAVAAKLGNTVTVCRRSYVHPLILEGYLDGRLFTELGESNSAGDGLNGLSDAENRVSAYLRSAGATLL